MPPNSVPQEVERQKKPGVQRIPVFARGSRGRRGPGLIGCGGGCQSVRDSRARGGNKVQRAVLATAIVLREQGVLFHEVGCLSTAKRADGAEPWFCINVECSSYPSRLVERDHLKTTGLQGPSTASRPEFVKKKKRRTRHA